MAKYSTEFHTRHFLKESSYEVILKPLENITMNLFTSTFLSQIVLVQFDFLILGIILIYLIGNSTLNSEVKFLARTSETSSCRTSTVSSAFPLKKIFVNCQLKYLHCLKTSQRARHGKTVIRIDFTSGCGLGLSVRDGIG